MKISHLSSAREFLFTVWYRDTLLSSTRESLFSVHHENNLLRLAWESLISVQHENSSSQSDIEILSFVLHENLSSLLAWESLFSVQHESFSPQSDIEIHFLFSTGMFSPVLYHFIYLNLPVEFSFLTFVFFLNFFFSTNMPSILGNYSTCTSQSCDNLIEMSLLSR